jgi:hypothetical protein
MREVGLVELRSSWVEAWLSSRPVDSFLILLYRRSNGLDPAEGIVRAEGSR